MNLLNKAVAAQVVAAPAAILLDAGLKSVAVLALAGLAVRCMKRCSAASRHLVLALAMGSLLILPVLSWSLPGWDLLPRWMGVEAAAAARMNLHLGFTDVLTEASTAGTEADGGVWRSALSPPGSARTASTGIPTAGFEQGTRPSQEQRQWTPFRWAITVWLIGVCCVALPTIAGLVSLARLRRKALKVDTGALAQMVQTLSAELILRRRVVLLITPTRRIPMTWGAFHPRILLPAEAVEWPEERQRVVLLHELAHIQRCDFLTNLVAQFARAVYWFNPLVWLVVRQIRSEQEQACDDIVLREGTKPTRYAEEVLQIAAGHMIGGLEAIGAVAMARSSSLEGRLLAILDRRRNRASLSKVGILSAGALMGLAIVPISMLRASQNVAAGAPAAAVAAESGLVAWWRGEEDGRDTAGRHEGAFPFGIRYEEGLVGQAFDMRRSYAIEHQLQRVSIKDAPEFELSDEMTLEAWIYPREYGGIVLHRGDDRPGFDTWQVHLMTKGRIDFTFNAADNRGTSISAPIQLNQWQHVVVTFDHGAMKLFINGVVAAQGTTELRPIAKLDTRYNPAVGIGNVGGTNFSMPFDGLIDEVRIYNRALSEAEVRDRLKR